jgi:hypothetical protein
MTHKPDKTAKEKFDDMWSDLQEVEVCGDYGGGIGAWEDEKVWNWHISQLKSLEKEINSGLHIQAYGFKGWWISVRDVLDLIKKYTK